MGSRLPPLTLQLRPSRICPCSPPGGGGHTGTGPGGDARGRRGGCNRRVPFPPPSLLPRSRPLPPWSQVQTTSPGGAGRGARTGPDRTEPGFGSPGATAGSATGGPPAPAGLHGESVGDRCPFPNSRDPAVLERSPPPRTAGMRGGQLGRGGICSSRDPLGTGLVLLGWGFGSTRRGDGLAGKGLFQPGKGLGLVRQGRGLD